MFKLFRFFKAKDWVFLTLILGFTVLSVWGTMEMTDYVSGIIKAISNLQTHNEWAGTVNTAFGGDWNAFYQAIIASGQAVPKSTFDAVANASTSQIWWNAGMMILFATAMMAGQIITSAFSSKVSADFATSVRKAENDKITHMSLEEIGKFQVSSLVTRTTNDVQQVQFAFVMAFRMIFSAPVTAIWAVLKIQASGAWQLTLVTAGGIVLLLIVVICILVFALPRFRVIQKWIDRVNGITRDNLTGVRVVRAYNAEQYEEDKFASANGSLTKLQLFTSRLLALMSPMLTLIMNGITLAIYWVGAYLINGDSNINYAGVTQYMMLASQIVIAFLMLLLTFVMIPRAEASAKRINEVLDSKNRIVEPAIETPIQEAERGSLEFRDVGFAYPGAAAESISHVSFKAMKGQTVAFIGATGSGKSTAINLIPRLFDATSGEVLVDGVNVKELKSSTLNHIVGLIPQKAVLFSGTVHSNIAFSNPDLPMERVEKAAEVACCDFVKEMPEGFESHIAQGGTNVSGGQKQRLCIARAIAADREILIFDDSFSALDFKTDRLLRENLKNTFPETTKVLVAQRIGTIMDADLIVVLKDGKAVGVGKHRELLENCPTYRDIALSQLSAEELGL